MPTAACGRGAGRRDGGPGRVGGPSPLPVRRASEAGRGPDTNTATTQLLIRHMHVPHAGYSKVCNLSLDYGLRKRSHPRHAVSRKVSAGRYMHTVLLLRLRLPLFHSHRAYLSTHAGAHLSCVRQATDSELGLLSRLQSRRWRGDGPVRPSRHGPLGDVGKRG